MRKAIEKYLLKIQKNKKMYKLKITMEELCFKNLALKFTCRHAQFNMSLKLI